MAIVSGVFLGLLLAAAAPALHRLARGATGWLLAAFPAGLCVHLAIRLGEMPSFEETIRWSWTPSLAISLAFHIDGLSILFAFLILGVGALVLIYAGGYLAGHPRLGRFYAFLMFFMSSMLGLVLADNLLALFIFWELTSLSSYFLIGFESSRPQSRSAALQALLVTGGGGLALLAGLVLLGLAGVELGLSGERALEISSLSPIGGALREHALYAPALILVLFGAFTKSAQFPFHFWLPGAMEAPTPVSAYLHSATMVKAGVYLLARLHPMLGGTELWYWSLTGGGAATMLIAAAWAVRETDLKRILAYSTVSALGVLVFLLGIGSESAAGAAMTFLLAHGLYKGALFLVAGAVDHETGMRDVGGLGGLWRAMPLTAACASLAGLSMAGVPPMFGFIAKDMVYEATLHSPGTLWATSAATATGMLFVALSGIVVARPFFGPVVETPKTPHEAPLSLWLGPALLAAGGVGFAFFPQLVDAPILTPARQAVLSGPDAPSGGEKIGLGLWHGWTTALFLSIVTLVGGAGVYGVHRILRAGLQALPDWGPARWYECCLVGLNALARVQTDVLQSGRLRYYLLTVLLTTVALTGGTLALRVCWSEPVVWTNAAFYEFGLAGLIVLAILATLASQSRLTAIAALGVVGYGVAILFVLFGAPDLAMTQFLIETLTVILFVLVFYHLPPSARLSDNVSRMRDGGVAVAVGALMTVLTLLAVSSDALPSISPYYGEQSYAAAHGRNVVNVILVDFRGLDTLGEITVLAAAATGVYALLKLRPERRGE